jgi:hypothetical protein
MLNECRVLVGMPKERALGKPRHRRENINKTDLRKSR